jgi:hypothetical protein
MSGRYMSSPSGGPCWSRDKGYHQPAKLPDHIQRIITTTASGYPVHRVDRHDDFHHTRHCTAGECYEESR